MTTHRKRLLRWSVGALVLLGFPFWLYSCMILMPGKSHRGPLPPLTPAQSALVPGLRRDIVELAEKIGERNVVKYAELRKAAFSNVCIAIETLDDEMSLEAISSFMRAAAEKDLKKLPDLLLDFTVKQDGNNADVAFGARVALASFTAIRKGRTPFNVLYSLGELDQQTCEETRCQHVGKAMRFTSAVAYALAQGGDTWFELFRRTVEPADRNVMAVAVLLLVEKRVSNLSGTKPPVFVLDVAVLNQFLLQPFGMKLDIEQEFRMSLDHFAVKFAALFAVAGDLEPAGRSR